MSSGSEDTQIGIAEIGETFRDEQSPETFLQKHLNRTEETRRTKVSDQASLLSSNGACKKKLNGSFWVLWIVKGS